MSIYIFYNIRGFIFQRFVEDITTLQGSCANFGIQNPDQKSVFPDFQRPIKWPGDWVWTLETLPCMGFFLVNDL